MSRLKIFAWADSPSVPTGFGVVMKNLLPRFQTMGYDVVTLGINEFGFDPRATAAFSFPIYPCRPGSPEQIYGFDRLWGIVENEKPDVLFLLNDPWLIQNAMAI